jgi:hypothetical protein
MSTSTNVWVQPQAIMQPTTGAPKQSGSSTQVWAFIGVIWAPQVIAIFQCSDPVTPPTPSLRAAPTLTAAKDGGIFPSFVIGTTTPNGSFCFVQITSGDPNNWTIRVRSDKDGDGGGVTYTVGSGGGTLIDVGGY